MSSVGTFEAYPNPLKSADKSHLRSLNTPKSFDKICVGSLLLPLKTADCVGRFILRLGSLLESNEGYWPFSKNSFWLVNCDLPFLLCWRESIWAVLRWWAPIVSWKGVMKKGEMRSFKKTPKIWILVSDLLSAITLFYCTGNMRGGQKFISLKSAGIHPWHSSKNESGFPAHLTLQSQYIVKQLFLHFWMTGACSKNKLIKDPVENCL